MPTCTRMPTRTEVSARTGQCPRCRTTRMLDSRWEPWPSERRGDGPDRAGVLDQGWFDERLRVAASGRSCHEATRRMGGALGRRWTEAQVDGLLAVLGVDDVLPQLGQDLFHRLQIEPRACHVGGLVELGHELEEARRIAGGFGDVLILFALRGEHDRSRLTARLGQEVVRIAPALVDLVLPVGAGTG